MIQLPTEFNPLKSETERPLHEMWYLKLNDPSTQRAFWLRFTLLHPRNGFKRLCEVAAVYFEKTSQREIKKVALKQTYGLDAFQIRAASKASPHLGQGVKMADNELTAQSTTGQIVSKGNSIHWDLSFTPESKTQFSLIPKFLSRSRLVKTSMKTLCEELIFTGITEINGERIHWKEAPGILGYRSGSIAGHSWTWGQCNAFVDEAGKPTPFVFEGLTAQTRIGPFRTPSVSSFYFRYRQKDYHFNTLKDLIHIQSKANLNQWEFVTDRGELVFRGYIQSEYKDFAGLTDEDTQGSLLYFSNSKLSNMKVLVYRKGKLESTFTAEGTVAFEVVSRTRNPYVPLLI
ncbi:MAG: hypothetical protein ACO3A2_11720 [Bdellovibrionia bacterium]